MNNQPEAGKNRGKRFLLYGVTIVGVAVVTFLITALLLNIFQRKREAEEYYFERVEINDKTIDPKVWGMNFPLQYEDYLRTVDVVETRHGGSEAFSKLEKNPLLVRLYAGYLFSVDFREERGHAYMLKDQDETERVKKGKQPGACLHCHASVLPAYLKAGNGESILKDTAAIMKGFETVCAMDYNAARKLVNHPVACIDCHDPETMHLRVTRPGFLNGIKELAKSDYPLPHFPSIERWRKGDKKEDYDVNELANHQEKRSFVCGQCHVEYYFQGKNKLLTYPWHNGLKVEQIEGYYQEKDFTDWIHAETQTPVLKAQHPEFELWNQGIHARSGVACADCHMPYKRVGAIKISDHHVRSPLLNTSHACRTCHPYPEEELKSRAEAIQDRTLKLMGLAESALKDMLDAFQKAGDQKVPAESLKKAQQLHRQAQWYYDFVQSENSMGFHAPQESARILAEAVNSARQAQLALVEAMSNSKE